MQSLQFLPELEKLPADPSSAGLDSQGLAARLRRMDGDQFAAGVSIATEEVLEALFDWRNVDDDLEKAYANWLPDSEQSLREHYQEVLERGEKAAKGFVDSNLKGRVAEVKSEDLLEQQFPGLDFKLAPDPNQPDSDLYVPGPEGTPEILVSVKAGGEEYAYQVARKMESALESPQEFWFAVNRDIYEKLHESYPELVQSYGNRLIDLGLDNAEFTEGVRDGLETLSGNLGIDVPDSLGEALPYIAEVAMGVRLIWNIVSTERDLAGEEMSDRARVHGVRTLTLMSKFGVNQVCTWAGVLAGGAAGTFIVPGAGSGVGSVAGGLAGAGGGMLLNRMLQPRIDEVAIKLVGGDADDLFYLMNKQAVDEIGTSLATTSVGEAFTLAQTAP